MRRGTAFFVVLAGLCVLIGGFAYFHFVAKPQMIREIMAQTPMPVVTVAAEEARAETWEEALTAVGTLRAVQGVDLANQVEGVVKAIKFVSGDDVALGATLIQLDDSVEQADLKSAQADFRRYAADYERQRELVARGNVSKAGYDAALNQRDTAAASIERIRATIAKKNIQAPFAGRTGIRRIDVGQYLPVGTMIATLQDMDPVYADFPLPEQFFGQVREGQAVQVTLDAYPGRVFSGRVQSIDAQVSRDSRTFLARAEIPNPDKRAVPGMFANVQVLTGKIDNVLTVPRTAVTYSLYGDNVLVVTTAPGAGDALMVERRFVRLGEVRGERQAIIDGIKPGERIVTVGQLKLDQGTRVKIDNTASLQPLATRPKQ
jgi:membrane fusion protein, multidrug efflux system